MGDGGANPDDAESSNAAIIIERLLFVVVIVLSSNLFYWPGRTTVCSWLYQCKLLLLLLLHLMDVTGEDGSVNEGI